MCGATNEEQSRNAGGHLSLLLQRLPQPLAVLLKEYVDEEGPYAKLCRIWHCSEMLVRFSAVIAFAQWRQANLHEPNHGVNGRNDDSEDNVQPPMPESLRDALVGDYEKNTNGIRFPSFGDWLTVLDACTENFPANPGVLIPEMSVFYQQLKGLILPDETEQRTPERCVYDLRNDLSHRGRFSNKEANKFLADHGHQERFEAFWAHPATQFLSELSLWGVVSADRASLFRGQGEGESDSPLAEVVGDKSCDSIPQGSLLLKREDRRGFLQLFPLIVVGPVLHWKNHQLEPVTDDVTTQIYSRHSDKRMECTAMHPDFTHGYASEEFSREFKCVFPLKAWRDERDEARLAKKFQSRDEKELDEKLSHYGFRDIVRPLLEPPAAPRDCEIDTLRDWLDGRRQGCAVITAGPGMGKSWLAAKWSVELKKVRRDILTIRYFFKGDDDRCSTRSFMKSVLLHLQRHGGHEAVIPRDPKKAEEVFFVALDAFSKDFQPGESGDFVINGETTNDERRGGHGFAKLVLIVDGLDEIASQDPRIFSLIRRPPKDGVVWMCFTQPTDEVLKSLPLHAEQLFSAEGLPGLDRTHVRQLLMDSLGRHDVFKLLETENDDGRSRFLEEITHRAAGSPAYLRHLLDDIRRGETDFFRNPRLLPHGMNDVYDNIIRRDRLDPAGGVMAEIVGLLAVAYRPLTTETLRKILDDSDLAKDPEFAEILEKALRIGDPLLKDRYLAEGVSGHTIYDDHFRDYLLDNEKGSYKEFPTAPVLRTARVRLLQFCSRWKELEGDSLSHHYALRFYPRHLLAEGKYDTCASLLRNLDFLESKIRAGFLEELVSDYGEFAKSTSESKEDFSTLSLIGNALRADKDFLVRHPDSLFQTLRNRLACGACPEGPSPIDSIVRDWEEQVAGREQVWIRALAAEYPIPHEAHGSDVSRLVVSSDGERFGAFSLAGRLTVERTLGGRFEFFGNQFSIPLAFGLNGHHLLVGTDQNIQVWDVGQQTREPVQELEIPPERLLFASTAEAGRPVRILTARGNVWEWAGPGRDWEVTELLSDDLIAGDYCPANDRWLLLTSGDAVSVEAGKIVSRIDLPADLVLEPDVRIGESNELFPMEPNSSDSEPAPKHYPMAIGIYGLCSHRHRGFPEFLERYGALLNPLVACSASANAVVALAVEEPSPEERDLDPDLLDKTIACFWRASLPLQVRRVSVPNLSITSVGFNPTGEQFAVGCDKGEMLTFCARSGELMESRQPLDHAITAVAFSSGHARPIAAGKWIDAQRSDAIESQARVHGATVSATTTSADGRFFATGDKSGRIVVWDAATGQIRHQFVGRRIYLGRDEGLQFVETNGVSDAIAWIDTGHLAEVVFLSFISGSHEIVSACEGGVFRVWNAETGEAVQTESIDAMGEMWPPRIWGALSRNGQRFALLDASGELVVWARDGGPKFVEIYRRSDIHDPVNVALSREGRHLALYAGSDLEIRDLNLGIEVSRFGVAQATRNGSVAFLPLPRVMQLYAELTRSVTSIVDDDPTPTPDPRDLWVLVTGDDSRLVVFDLDTGGQMIDLPTGGGGLVDGLAVAHTPDRWAYAYSAGPCIQFHHWSRDTEREMTEQQDVGMYWGRGDLQALAEGAGRFPYRAIRYDDVTTIYSEETEAKLGVYPLALDHLVTGTDGRTWCGASGRYVHILRIEGVPIAAREG